MFFPLTTLMLNGCVTLHHAQVGEVDSDIVLQGEYFEIMLSEVGVNVDEVVDFAQMFAGSKEGAENLEAIGELIKLFQMGPRTGNPVFYDDYSDQIFMKLSRTCPSGRISGLTAIRETADYSMISGEIVKLTGYCARRGPR